MPGRPPAHLAAALREFRRTKHARACADPAGAYANCLAASARCAEWLRARGIGCGLLMFSGSLEPFPDGAGRWPFCEPLECRHWTVRAGSWSIDWTARQFRPDAGWPEVSEVVALAARWRLTADWACDRCPELLATRATASSLPPCSSAPTATSRARRAAAARSPTRVTTERRISSRRAPAPARQVVDRLQVGQRGIEELAALDLAVAGSSCGRRTAPRARHRRRGG